MVARRAPVAPGAAEALLALALTTAHGVALTGRTLAVAMARQARRTQSGTHRPVVSFEARLAVDPSRKVLMQLIP